MSASLSNPNSVWSTQNGIATADGRRTGEETEKSGSDFNSCGYPHCIEAGRGVCVRTGHGSFGCPHGLPHLR